jgi:hypothetical protein
MVGCKLKATIEKEITLVGSTQFVFYIIMYQGKATFAIQNFRHMVHYINHNNIPIVI